MNPGNAWVLGGSVLVAALVGGLTASWVPDVGAGISAALLSGLTALMLGGWLSTHRAVAR
ncbi:MAG: hypothetical protein KJ015_05220 [Myxococcales bacterium]|nr:hypothetical protein [Myxococcales bacterium]